MMKILKGEGALSSEHKPDPYRIEPDGIYYGAEWLCSPLKLVGSGTDSSGNYFRIIEYRDRFTGEIQNMPIAGAEIGTGALWARLQGVGIAVASKRRRRDFLADYLQSGGRHERWMITGRAGWVVPGRIYILPGGEILATKGCRRSKVIYNGDRSPAAGYRTSGSLNDWQAGVARYATDNSRLCLALGAAFAAPLMRLLDIEGGGFHLFGDSSDGKTTTAKVALSVWGSPEELKLSWEGTGLGFANVANACNDGLMLLDEIGQANPRVVSHTAYSIINGKGKVQGAKEGGNREVNRWRVLVLSTGEKTMEGYLKTHQGDWQAGQANRLPSIPANAGKGHGVYDVLHGFSDGALLSEHLNLTTAQYHGTAGRAFVNALLNDAGAVKKAGEYVHSFQAALPLPSGQARRVGQRFALASAALMLAADYGIIPFTGSPGIRQCFDEWMARDGGGKFEDRKIIEQAIAFMQTTAFSDRFSDYPSGIDRVTGHGFAGYRKRGTTEEEDSFYIVPLVFENELGKGFDKAKVCEVLHAVEWLKRYESATKARWKHQLKDRGRFYLLIGHLPPEENIPPESDI